MSSLGRLLGRVEPDSATTADVVELIDHVEALKAHMMSLDGALRGLTDHLAALQSQVEGMNHSVDHLTHLVHHGAPEGLPLLVGYLERLHTDADTAVSAVTIIERQLARFGPLADVPAAEEPSA